MTQEQTIGHMEGQGRNSSLMGQENFTQNYQEWNLEDLGGLLTALYDVGDVQLH